VQYGDSTAKLPELLQALRRGENIVSLGNGDYGILPEEWLRRFGHVAGMGTPVNGHLRFQSNQAGLLDALLAAQPEATCDETFARVRQELASFQGIEPAEQPPGFLGQLRDYQREGLGWMHFLRRFSFGGCLADDMGVGKTAQVLALLEDRRQSRGPQAEGRPSLVVVPKSLVFNWKLEAARFTPQLRVLDYTGVTRKADFADCDVVLTTYGTVRRDALALKDIEFDYVVLDEGQAVKNADSESSKAVRLLRGQHRLALSGTPIENHLGELWTLFEFLNPGMLGASSAFKLLSGPARNPSEDARRLLAGALRPFVLRRTKEQVARELPPKTEQTIYCEMEPLQRKLYQELLQHYRDLLLKRIETDGIAKSKIQVLEALLRLRQAACHPGLLDPKRKVEPSAKLEVLLSRVNEVIEEGHKALVFSQFTSMLHLVRSQLDQKQIAYEYLDGATRDRQARVEHFQNDPDCRLFLISLKAGGLGLNLTAAEYVFLLDPWWNPAVEAQAMDRAHRIGQTRPGLCLSPDHARHRRRKST
jgi:SNF2 family DNA or RNA helicase